MQSAKETLSTVNKIKNETISRYISGIACTVTLGVFPVFLQSKMMALAYTSLTISILTAALFAYTLIKHWIGKMIDQRAAELFAIHIKPVDDLIRRHQQDQYKINNTYSDLLTKTGLRISAEVAEMKKKIDTELAEKQLPTDIALSLLISNLSRTTYNGENMKSRTHLDDFTHNFKDVLLKMNIPGKDNQYKEQLLTNYFRTITSLSN